MTRQLEQAMELRLARRHEAVIRAVEFELIGAIAHGGGELRGFSVKLGDLDVLMTLRAKLPGGDMIAFVGGEDLGSVLLKCVRDAASDNLRWRADNFSKESS